MTRTGPEKGVGVGLESRLTFKVVVGAQLHGVNKELHKDISGHKHEEQDTQ